MENKRPRVPKRRGYDDAYALACKLAAEKLTEIDIEQQCRNGGAEYKLIDSQKTIVLQYLNQTYHITLPDVEIFQIGDVGEVPTRDKILILHYLLTARGTPSANKLITFRELPEGSVYYPTFSQRTVKPILNYFAQEADLIIEIARRLGGRKAEYGDVAVTIDAFSRIPITFVLWRGDEEFAPQGNVLFDANIPDYLPTEDITVLCETITWRLIRHLQEFRKALVAKAYGSVEPKP
jgi:hypothetical protein